MRNFTPELIEMARDLNGDPRHIPTPARASG
jgi:hypothetical protein